jgi:carotenoid cleavage dioxygenase-like enzyme
MHDSRDGSEVQQMEVPSHFLFHFANAFEEEDGRLIVDFAKSDRLELGNTDSKLPVWKTVDYPKDVPYTQLVRYSFVPSATNKGKFASFDETLLSKFCAEFPSVNPVFSCKKVCAIFRNTYSKCLAYLCLIQHRYIYAGRGLSLEVPTPIQGLVKVDCEAGTEQSWIGELHEFLGESIFVPRTGASSAEDDGYLLSTLHNCRDKTTSLAVFDAKDVAKGPISRIALPVFLPFGLHGSYADGLTFNFDDVIRRFKVFEQ